MTSALTSLVVDIWVESSVEGTRMYPANLFAWCALRLRYSRDKYGGIHSGEEGAGVPACDPGKLKKGSSPNYTT